MAGGKGQPEVRKNFVVFFLMLCGALSWAQSRKAESFIQEGTATAGLQESGLVAAHPSLPMETRLMVKNQASGKEVEVTIKGRIQASFNRIIDLSPDAAQAIDLKSGGAVVVYIADTPAPLAAAKPKPKSEPAPSASEPAPVVSESVPVVSERLPEQAPVAFKPGPEPAPAVPEPLPEKAPVVFETKPDLGIPLPEQGTVTLQPVPPPAQHTPPQIHYILPPTQHAPAQTKDRPPQTQATVAQENPVKIISVLPNPNSEKHYNLQIGAFSSILSADLVFRQLRGSGFEAAQEQSGDLYRVLVVGIPASQVYNAIQKLGVLGFREIWVRE